MEQQQKSYTILATLQAVLGLVIGGAVFGLFYFQPGLINDRLTTQVTGYLGLAAAGYYISLHQLIRRRYPAASTLVLTLISILNLAFLIAITGGLDSPYYALWLLAIVTAGIFGRPQTLAVISVTVAYNLYTWSQNSFATPFLRDHSAQLLLSLAAGALAEWVYERSRRAASQTAKVATLAGRLTEEQLKAQVLMSSIAEAVIVVNSEGQIQFFNQAAQQLTGWGEGSAQNIQYNLVLNLHTAQDQDIPAGQDPISEAWAKGSSLLKNDLVIITKSGRRTPISISVSPIYDAGHIITGGIALVRDITQEKEIERQRNEFISTASHEMRTPVAAIEGYLALALNPNVATIDDRARGFLTKAHDNIIHLGDLFRDLLSVTKIDGQLQLQVGEVNLTDLVRAVVEDMQFAAQKKGLKLNFTPGTRAAEKAVAPIYLVRANSDRLREVVVNLVDNALKFTSAGNVTVTIEGDHQTVTVKVSDSGIGIAAEDVSHLFQKFYRVDSSATRTIGGTGLGLYLCRSIIEMFNGRIWVESTLGKGSSFNFSLPRIEPQPVTAPSAPVALAPSAPPTPTAAAPVPATALAVPAPTPEARSMTDIRPGAAAAIASPTTS